MLALLQYMDCTDPVDNVEKMLNCVCMRGNTSDNDDYSMSRAEEAFGVRENGEWFGIEPFRSIEGCISVVKDNHPIALFTKPPHWAQQRFCVHRFASVFEKAM